MVHHHAELPIDTAPVECHIHCKMVPRLAAPRAPHTSRRVVGQTYRHEHQPDRMDSRFCPFISARVQDRHQWSFMTSIRENRSRMTVMSVDIFVLLRRISVRIIVCCAKIVA